MKKLHLMAAVAMAVAGSAAMAANLQPSQVGSTCGAFHFVNNQSGSAEGTLTVEIAGVTYGPLAPDKKNGPTRHWFIYISGTVTSAFTDLPGNLVLSDCFDAKEPPKK